MANKKTVRKKNIKVRKQIRRTMGALFLISAIVVAAIPVDSVSADTGVQTRAAAISEKRQDVLDYEAKAGVDGGKRGNPVYDPKKFVNEELDGSNYLESPNSANDSAAYIIRKLGDGSWSLYWQFKYYTVKINGTDKAIISDYNNDYPESTVVLSNTANVGYYVVENSTYQAFYDEATTPKTEGNTNKTISYDNDFLEYKKNGIDVGDMEWYREYQAENFKLFMDACEAYYKKMQQYNDDHAKWVLDGSPSGKEPVKPDESTKPTSITVNPGKDFSSEQKLKYYCNFDKELEKSGTGYELVAVTDNRPTADSGGSTATSVYVAWSNNGNGKPLQPAYNDVNGFLVIDKSKEIAGIGNGAFKGVTNVDTLTIPTETAYIGTEAFQNSFIKSINLQNVQNIGHRAFSGCSQLTNLTLGDGTKKIGDECFYNSGLTSIKLPYSVSSIGEGAFAKSRNLKEVDFSAISSECVINQYAFYDCYSLDTVNMKTSAISYIGEGAFAIATTPGGNWVNAELPEHMASKYGTNNSMGDYLFAGRTNLKTVVFPVDYGSGTTAVTIPRGMFVSCRSLEWVEFPDAGNGTCGMVSYDPNLFLDVTNAGFYVKGPEKSADGKIAKPRESTWAAITTVSDIVPYIFKDGSGLTCYEVCDGNYLLQADETGSLNSCELVSKSGSTKPIDLVIPSYVGEYRITSVASDCFEDEALRKRLRSITVSDNSLTTLADSVFEGLPNLEEVLIGNSVESIGAKAFANCPKLTEVTFNPPSVGYDKFTIGTDAFKTNSSSLTFYGDIVADYEPFKFAMGAESGKIDINGKRICYRSLSPDYLTVMYNPDTEDVTLLGYPMYKNLDDDHKDYCDSMEALNYQEYGVDYVTEDDENGNPVVKDVSKYAGLRKAFAEAWKAACEDPDAAAAQAAVYASEDYGPWIDDVYVMSGGGFATDYPGVPIPDAYYDHPGNAYSIKANYERGAGAKEFESVTDTELEWVSGTLNIVVPPGITSIDAAAYFNSSNNNRNIATYFDSSSRDYEIYQKCKSTTASDVVGGLFSGSYVDYDKGDPEKDVFETIDRGNDRIRSVVMYDVKELPEYAFDSCERLERVELGAACEDIGKAPFRGCYNLVEVAGNEHYTESNGIIYSVNPDETYTIEECLPARGDKVGQPYIDTNTDPYLANVSAITGGAFEDCDHVVRVYLTDSTVKIIPKDCFKDCDKLNTVDLPETVSRIEEGAFLGDTILTVTIPGKEVNIETDAFEHLSTVTIASYEGSSALDYARYHGINPVVLDGRFKVEFIDYDGTALCNPQYVEKNKTAVPPEKEPVREGYTFTGWSAEYTNITKDMVIIAQYVSNSDDSMKYTVTFWSWDDKVVSEQHCAEGESAVAPLAPTRSGYTFKEWKPGTYTKVTKDLDVYPVYEPSSNNSDSKSSSSPGASASSSSSSASPTASEGTKYTVSVSGGSGSGSYTPGTIVTINATTTGDGRVFDRWTTSSTGVGFADATSATTTFTMPSNNVTITATYKTGSATGNTAGGNSGSGSSSGSGSGGSGGSSSGTRVEVTKPGISNTDLAAANVNGALDNFVVKITENAEATSAAMTALQKTYGDISNVKYLPMDISLYDSTGTTKITDTSGITVDITLPLPDDLVEYAGNNKVASVTGGTLEKLDSKFKTIDGVPCVTFTASHFSPYMVYVDTANLTEGMIDTTPKTGDLLHPKWFLSIGLACIAMVLFFKKDKVLPKAKTV